MFVSALDAKTYGTCYLSQENQVHEGPKWRLERQQGPWRWRRQVSKGITSRLKLVQTSQCLARGGFFRIFSWASQYELVGTK